mmetsp:Transcript_16561/g.23361  ORF Transcript_16561/g.23361 Transcript_16561/m.23361 type:complete len:215 (-) Transcript_16561:48-692(-)
MHCKLHNVVTTSTLILSFVVLSIFLQEQTQHHVKAMRIVVQRVKSASVTVDGQVVSKIGPGAMALVGLHEHDTTKDLEYCCKRLLACKLWENANGSPWRHGLKQKEYELLCVSQFTLYGTLSKKNQPDYKRSMKNIPAQALYNEFLGMLKDNYQADKVFDGVFGAKMAVELINDGPVTIVFESEPQAPPPSEPTLEDANGGDVTSTDDKVEKDA